MKSLPNCSSLFRNRLYIHGRPTKLVHIYLLLAHEVKTVISLTQNVPNIFTNNANLLKDKIEIIHLPIKDQSTPTLDEVILLCKTISKNINQKKNISIHCAMGNGRSGLMLACFMIWNSVHNSKKNAKLWSCKKSIKYVRSKRSKSIENAKQTNFITNFRDHILKRFNFV
ncbi:hypothetical protein A3Q56_00694 [Intoshia linei]|uniref:Uncharacterized protein n=1 Tax=Intoshia linei TaxID=1819745 RepID=A0A177BB67_9BILA|nr:hypothetical protein A3Q56_00694 [Intoshia linei]